MTSGEAFTRSASMSDMTILYVQDNDDISQWAPSEHNTEHDDNAKDSASHKYGSNKKNVRLEREPSTYLRCSTTVIYLTLVYSALALFAWGMTLFLTYRPIGCKTYSTDLVNHMEDYWVSYYQSRYYQITGSEKWYKAARVIQAITSILTIPLVSTVCAAAAVIFIQRQAYDKRFTLQQMIVLADNGWTAPHIWFRLLTTQGWKQCGNSFLAVAILLNILGCIIAPLQQIFLSTVTIKVPTVSQYLGLQVDISDHFGRYDSTEQDQLVVTTRVSLTASNLLDIQPRLWQSDKIDCAARRQTGFDEPPISCVAGGVTFANFSNLEEPFFAQLASSFTTGMIRQFVPRINSTVQMDIIPADRFPEDCGDKSNSFFIHYSAPVQDEVGGFSLTACMPANMAASPWTNTRHRQDISEELYLHINLDDIYSNPAQDLTTTFKITIHTTAGFFQLPNYMNNGKPGPLLQNGPTSEHCNGDCKDQGFDITSKSKPGALESSAPKWTVNNTNTTVSSEAVPIEGPLLRIAMALFGDASFIQQRVAQFESLLHDTSSNVSDLLQAYCYEPSPMHALLNPGKPYPDSDEVQSQCREQNVTQATQNLSQQIRNHIDSFMYSQADFNATQKGEIIQNAFSVAAFLANEAWMTCNVLRGSLPLYYDLGDDLQKPSISWTGIVVISVLLGSFLLGIFVLSLYSAWTPRWTQRLDAFVMMHIGAAVVQEAPLTFVSDSTRLSVFKNTPGWIGDSSEGVGNVGMLGLGAGIPLARNRRFRCHIDDHERPARRDRLRKYSDGKHALGKQ